MKPTHWLLPAAFASLVAGQANAADALDSQQFEERFSGEAVSALNAKVEAGGFHISFDDNGNNDTNLESAHGYVVQGAVSLPIGSQFGLQIDAGTMHGSADADSPFFGSQELDIEAYGLGGHLFWRDPGTGLLGVYAHQTEYDIEGVDITHRRFGVSGEAYLGNFTLKGFGGQDHVKYDSFADGTYWAASGEVDFYFTDDFMVKAGIEHSFNSTSGFAGIEAAFSSSNVASALFADVSFGEAGTTAMAGLRFYFGQEAKSLKRRHREDDPDINLFDNFGALGSCVNGLSDLPDEPELMAKTMEMAPTRMMPTAPDYDADNCDVDFKPYNPYPMDPT
ncbi:MAG: hypothetical protein M9908_03240 [Phyllobacteriaceae bacterium]|nr:hypothetical protein [Phyllobacteriaceae bacterium]